MVTIKEVAKHAGVSLGTVSRVINGAQNVSPKTRKKVKESIQVLGYFPNNVARALVRRQSGAIAVLLRNLHSPFFTDLIHGFEDGVHQTKRKIFFCSLGKNRHLRDQYIQFLTGGVADAIIIYGSLYTDQPMIEHLQSINFSFLLIENNSPSMKVSQFLVKNHDGALSAVNFLVYKGHSRIAHFMGDPNKKVNLDRFNGYIQAMHDHHLHIHQDDLYHTMSDTDIAFQFAQDIMRRNPADRPTAIFCCSDRIAASAIMGITELGFKVPRDISVIGFDNQQFPHENYTGPRITSVSQPLYQMGLDSIKTISDILDRKTSEPITKFYNTTLQEHETVSSPPIL